MNLMIKIILLLLCIFFLYGCAQKAQKIQPVEMQYELFITDDCTELQRQINIEKKKLAFFEVLQREIYDDDVALFLFLGVTKSMFTNEDETNTNILAIQKGKLIAMEQAKQFSRCNSSNNYNKLDPSYVKASTGMVLISLHEGTIETKKHWVGIAVAKGGYRVDDYYSKNYAIKELVYQGISEGKIRFDYREFRRNLEEKMEFESHAYDINNNIITIRNFKLRVIEANNNFIRAKIIQQ